VLGAAGDPRAALLGIADAVDGVGPLAAALARFRTVGVGHGAAARHAELVLTTSPDAVAALAARAKPLGVTVLVGDAEGLHAEAAGLGEGVWVDPLDGFAAVKR